MINTRDRVSFVLAALLMVCAGVGLFLCVAGCSHPAPPVVPNRAIEYVTILDHGARCEDWRRGFGPDAAVCTSGDSLFWCVAPMDAKPHCDLLYAPPKPEAKKPDEPKVDATTKATEKPKEP